MSKLIRIYLDKIFIIKHIGLKNKKYQANSKHPLHVHLLLLNMGG